MRSEGRLFAADDLDAAFAFVAPNGDSTAGHQLATDLGEVHALFAQIAASHLGQVHDFVIALLRGEAPGDWIGICEPAIKALRRAAGTMGLDDVCGALDRFAEELSAV